MSRAGKVEGFGGLAEKMDGPRDSRIPGTRLTSVCGGHPFAAGVISPLEVRSSPDPEGHGSSGPLPSGIVRYTSRITVGLELRQLALRISKQILQVDMFSGSSDPSSTGS